jgi:hypothetical protein
MAENCARPTEEGVVCGHEPRLHGIDEEGEGYCNVSCEVQIVFMDTPIYKGPLRCTCHGFRTDLQQGAWCELLEVNQHHRFPPWTVIERLLELYP